MFRDLHTLLNSQDWYNISLEIEILKGGLSKPTSFKDRLEKLNRKYKYNKRCQTKLEK